MTETSLIIAKSTKRKVEIILAGIIIFGSVLVTLGAVWTFVVVYSWTAYDFDGDTEIVIHYGCNSTPALSLGYTFTPASGEYFYVVGGTDVQYSLRNAKMNLTSPPSGINTAGIYYSIAAWISFTGCIIVVPFCIAWIIYGAKEIKVPEEAYSKLIS